MTWVDWAIVVVMAGGAGRAGAGILSLGCSLGGLVLGLALAAWNYGIVAALLMPWSRIEATLPTLLDSF
jgi:hypothetical protein